MKLRVALTFSALLAASTAVFAQENPAGPGASDAPVTAPAEKDAVHKAWDELKAANDAMRAAAASKDAAKLTATRTEAQKAQDAFRTAFAASDWEKIDPKADGDLLAQGLVMLGGQALSKDDGKSAVKYYEALLAKLPESPLAKQAGARLLPVAHMQAGEMAKAVAIWEKSAESADAGAKCDALLNLGDVKAAQGDVAAAKSSWQKILDLPAGEKRDPVTQMKPYAELRLALVGSPAPEIDSKVWLGGEPKALSAHKGSVVVVDFWATWCPPCRAVMPGLSRLYDERKKDGLAVLGVTRYYKNGFLPKPGTKEPVSDGERLQEISEADFPAHLKQFKENVAISYPFVTAGEAEFQAYKVSGIPTMVVVDRSGAVSFVKVGGGDETLLHMAVNRALAETPAAPAPAPPKPGN